MAQWRMPQWRMPLRIAAALGCCAAAALSVLPQAHEPTVRDTHATLARALELERSGDFTRAESTLLEAARFNRQYLPAWTLANFYFRRNNPEQFWRWAARAAAINPYDFRPLLRLAGALEPHPEALLARLADRPELLRSYLDILIGEARMSEAQYVATRLRAHRDPADLPRFAALDDRLRTIRSAAPRYTDDPHLRGR